MRQRSYRTFTETRISNPKGVERVANDRGAWMVSVNTKDGQIRIPPGSDVRLDGFSGSAELVVACDPKTGEPLYDKLLYRQKPGVAIVAWGRDPETAAVKLAYLTQERPFAEDPEWPREEKPLRFGQIPMGFLNREERELLARGNTHGAVQAAATREVQEEIGCTVIKMHVPTVATLWQDPTFIQNGTYVAFARVDIASRGEPTGDPNEHESIHKVEFLTIPEVMTRLRLGRTGDGTLHHMGTSLGPLMLFFAHYAEHEISAFMEAAP